ncbi:MAG: arginine--tRNA ligase [Candidatus Odinarchaeum yellowstonii]|uniref:Arginine--tRNA ligase n=1 Tax=Odinarchaeota yellowstonii (strain LCB_4) TaxID=1841599 RepID=A0AAF0D1N5_ODILC|nr:MAG: arginine--tRNA ligase [Candidatus Odinarchaeum yellowstonii]
MVDPWVILKRSVAEILESSFKNNNWSKPEKDYSFYVEVPPDSKLGDLSSTIAFKAAKTLKMKPISIAAKIREEYLLNPSKFIEKVEVAEPGYLNFYIKWSEYSKLVLDTILNEGDRYGDGDIGVGKKVIVEHTSANPTKPIHLGTMRCAVLGDVTARLLRKVGYNVEVENYMDDLGRQVAVLTWGYENLSSEIEKKPEYKDDYWLGLIYTAAAQRVEEKSEFEERIRHILKKMEEGGNEYSDLAQRLVYMVVKSQLETAARMNIFYDLLIWEKDIVRSGLFKEALNKMLKSPHVYQVREGEDANCIVIDMSILGEPYTSLKKSYKILVRSDGVSTYTGKDIAFQMWKFGLAEADLKFRVFGIQKNGGALMETAQDGEANRSFGHADKVVNVIGYEQTLPQQIVYQALKIMGYEEAYKNSYHLSFQWVWLPEQVAFSGRKGTWIGFHADAVLDKAFQLAMEEVEKRNPDMEPELKKRIAEVIASGSVKFYLAKYSPEKKIIIDWKEAINFEGDSAPYVQYTIVRINSILSKVNHIGEPDYSLLTDETEIDLIRTLSKFPYTVREAAETYQYHLIPHYCLSLANKFNIFYHKLPVLKAEDEALRAARLNLIKAVAQTLKIGLKDLIGIDIPVKM